MKNVINFEEAKKRLRVDNTDRVTLDELKKACDELIEKEREKWFYEILKTKPFPKILGEPTKFSLKIRVITVKFYGGKIVIKQFGRVIGEKTFY